MCPISIKSALKCNTINSPFNKGGNPETVKIDSNRIAYRYPDAGIAVLKPVIDRLKFGFYPKADFFIQQGISETPESISKYLTTSLASDVFTGGDFNLSWFKTGKGSKSAFSLYKIDLWLKPSAGSAPIRIQAAPKKVGYALLRVDMNPCHMDEEGFSCLWDFVGQCFTLPGGSVSKDSFLSACRISSAEVSVDILGLRPNESEIKRVVGGLPKKGKSHTYKSHSGRTETIYPSAKAGKQNNEYLYDKRQELIDQGKMPVFGDVLHTRFEARIVDTTPLLLAKAHNRCDRYTIRTLCPQKFAHLSITEKLYVRLAVQRNPEKAAYDVPETDHAKYQALFEETMMNVWQPKTLWKSWPKLVHDVGLSV